MGRKKYFCDYCLKSFNDDPKARALHMNSFNHLQNKEAHYRNFKDPAVILQEELSKQPCLKYQTENYCRFGQSCKFSHLLPNQLDDLRAKVEIIDNMPTLPLFCEWWNKRKKCENVKKATISHEVNVPHYDLPISLRPYDVADFLTANLEEWGN